MVGMRDYATVVADDELGSVEDVLDDASWAVRRHSTSPSRRPPPASHQPIEGKAV
jgi:hypothetical protein